MGDGVGMVDAQWRARVRAAVYRGDGRAVIRLAGPDLDTDTKAMALQLIGDGLLRALDERLKGAGQLARDCAALLTQRGWPGDGELGAQLQWFLGTGTRPMLRSLPVDLAELADLLEGDPSRGGGMLNLATGVLWSYTAIDYARDTGAELCDAPSPDDNPDRWLPVEWEDSRAGYLDIHTFIDTLADSGHVQRWWAAIGDKGAFLRFKDALVETPGELDRWFAFAEERRRGRARAWLANAGYTPTMFEG